MKKVTRYLFGRNSFVHDITHVFHLEFIVSVSFHEAFLEQNFLVKEAFIAC